MGGFVGLWKLVYPIRFSFLDSVMIEPRTSDSTH